MKYEEIIFMQGDDATEALDIISEHGELAGIEHLAQWEPTGRVEDEKPTLCPYTREAYTRETSDSNYLMQYSYSHGLVALYRFAP